MSFDSLSILFLNHSNSQLSFLQFLPLHLGTSTVLKLILVFFLKKCNRPKSLCFCLYSPIMEYFLNDFQSWACHPPQNRETYMSLPTFDKSQLSHHTRNQEKELKDVGWSLLSLEYTFCGLAVSRNKLGLSRHFLDEEAKDPEGYFSWSRAIGSVSGKVRTKV